MCLDLNTNLSLDKHTVVQYHITTVRGRSRGNGVEFRLEDRRLPAEPSVVGGRLTVGHGLAFLLFLLRQARQTGHLLS